MGKLEKIEKLASKGKADKLLGFVGDKDKEVRLAAIASVSGMIERVCPKPMKTAEGTLYSP